MSASVSTVIEHEVGATGLIAIRVHSSAVRLRAVDGSTARITDPTGTLERSARIERGPGSLSVRAGHADRTFSLGVASVEFVAGRRTPDLDVEVPSGATVVIESASGDLTAVGLTGDQRYRTASGDVDLREVSGRLALDGVSGDVTVVTSGSSAIAARTVSGDLRIRGGHDLTACRIATTSGDIQLEGRFTGSGPFSIETVSGDTLLAPSGGVRIEAKTVTGDLRSTVPSSQDGGRGARTMTIRDGGATLTVRSLSGDIRVEEPARAVRPSGDTPTIALAAPTAPVAPEAPRPPEPPLAPPSPVGVAAADAVRSTAAGDPMTILQALERGEIDVDEASRRLAALDAGQPGPLA